jgi:hypothetical protein
MDRPSVGKASPIPLSRISRRAARGHLENEKRQRIEALPPCSIREDQALCQKL